MRKLISYAMVAIGLVLAHSAMAAKQNFPVRPVKMIVPWPAGGGTDLVARALGNQLSSQWGEPVIIENRPGASGNIGAQATVNAEPDGYTFMLTSMAIATNSIFFKSLRFDATKDLVPVMLLAGAPHVLVVRSDFPAKSLKDLLAMATSPSSKLQYSSAGPGSPFHLSMELLKVMTGAKIQHIPYKGGAPAVTAVLGKQVDMTFANIMLVRPYILNGSLRPLGISTKQRAEALPDVPTIAEQGVAGYDFTSWYGLFVPRGVDPAIVQKINDDVRSALQVPAVRKRFVDTGLQIIASSPHEFEEFMSAEISRWKQVAAKAGIVAE